MPELSKAELSEMMEKIRECLRRLSYCEYLLEELKKGSRSKTNQPRLDK